MSGRRLLRGLGAAAVLLALVGGVPAVLVLAVGNPWPGWARVQLGDERALVLGALATLGWIVWARFVLAVAMELPAQVAELRAGRARPAFAPVSCERVDIAPPGRSASSAGVLAARLIAAALVLVPIGGRITPAAAAPVPLVAAAPVAATFDAPAAKVPRPTEATDAPAIVAVAEGDTLVALARRHLGDANRWREIFELNRERAQPGDQRLTTPSLLQPGWTLLMPPGADVSAAPAAAAAERVSIVEGDTLWQLAHDRLESTGANHDDPSVAAYVSAIVDVNAEVIEDPDLIYPGEQIEWPETQPDPAVDGERPTAESPPATTAEAVPATTATTAGTTTTVTAATTTTTTTTATATAAAPQPVDARNATTSSPASSTTDAAPEPVRGDDVGAEHAEGSPAPIGLGEAALLSSGVLALLAARRRARLRASRPRARLPEPAPEQVITERALRAVDANERLVRLDVAVRAAAASLLDTAAQPAVMRVAPDGRVELVLTGKASLPGPWRGEGGRWVLAGGIPIELLGAASRSVGAPCLALTQLGVDVEGHEVFADLEALGVLAVHGADEVAEPILSGIAATLATSMLADVVSLVGVDVDEQAFLGHRLAHRVEGVEEAIELATTLIGTTAAARQSTFVLRARHTSGEAWEPAIVLTGPRVAHEVTSEVVRSVSRRRGGVAAVVAGDVPDGPWNLRPAGGSWRLEPLGLELTPVGLSNVELAAVYEVLRDSDGSLADVVEDAETATEEPERVDGEFAAAPWELMVRLLGPVDVVDRRGRAVPFERSKTVELIAWLTLHRRRSTRTAARTALWDVDVRDATFANIVSEARRATARHVPPPAGEEWLERTLTEQLPLHRLVVSDADVIAARLEHARVQPPQQAIATLRPAVELIRDAPFAETGYLWPDPEGITSNLVLLATSAATELAGHLLSMGDVDGVFWATGQGLRVLPGHEELIALRMRAHHRAGDLSGVRLEWETYERVLDADPWSGGEPAGKLVALRRELLSATP